MNEFSEEKVNPEAEQLPDILHDAGGWFVINKPAGLAVHPGPKTPYSLEALLPLYAPRRPMPQPVHRLDRDTSGCLLIARKSNALKALSRQFEEGQIGKVYWAIVENPPSDDKGEVDAPLMKVSTKETGWRMVVDPAGKRAVTEWEVLKRSEGLALVAFYPRTGRTHQIRVHATLLAEGCSLYGDPVYGTVRHEGMLLHSRSIELTNPSDGQRVKVECDLPAIYTQLIGEI